jgi:hypothetical protein
MFVQAHARRRTGREDPADILNEPEALAAGNPTVRISVTLVGGSVRNGTVFLDTPGPAPRPLDFLNNTHERFFALHASDAVRLINRDLIERVHPLD